MAWDSVGRTLSSRITYIGDNGETEFPSEAIQSWSISQLTHSSSLLKMGEFCQNAINLTYFNIGDAKKFAWNNKIISVYLKEENEEEVKIGTFHVKQSDVSTSDNGKTYQVEGYDIPQGMLEEFDNTQTTSSVSDIVSFITKKFGLSLAEGTEFSLDKIETVDEGTTYIELLSDIAGYDGYNLRMNKDGEIERYWYDMTTSDSTPKISYSIQFMNELKELTEVEKVNSIICYTSSDEYLTSGSGANSIEFENPYMTQSQLDSIFERIVRDDYVIGSVRWRGNPNVQAGDVVSIEIPDGDDTTKYMCFPVLENAIVYDGGFNMTSTAYSYEGTQTVIGTNTSPTEKKIQIAYNGLRDEYRRATGIIANNLDSGHYRLIEDENSKYPKGFMITDSETVTDTTKGWRFTQGGLEYSEDGFNTVSKVGITMDGKIVADSVYAHSLTIEAFDEELAQDIETAKTKSSIFYSQPVPPYSVNDLWCQGKVEETDTATTDDDGETTDVSFIGDILICVTAKTKDESFSEEDWTYASKYTGDAYAKIVELIANQAQANAQTANDNASSALDKANDAQSNAEHANSIAQDAQSQVANVSTKVDGMNETLNSQQTTLDTLSGNVTTASNSIKDIQDTLNLINTGNINELLQRITITANEGIKITASDSAQGTYILLKNDGLRIYVNGQSTPISSYLADYSSVAKIFAESGRLGKHQVMKWTMDGVQGTGFFYDENA